MTSDHRIHRTLPLALALLGLLGGCATSGPPSSSRAEADQADEQSDNRRAHSHYKMGSDHLRERRVAMAIRDLRIAEELAPEDKWTQLALADAYRRRARFADAELHLLKALRIDPGFQQASLTLSAIYIQLERYGEAIALTEKLADDPTFPIPWAALTNQGWAYYKLGQLKPAVEALELATEYESGYWRPVLTLGIIEAARGNREIAIARFERVVELAPGPLTEAEVNYRIAEIYEADRASIMEIHGRARRSRRAARGLMSVARFKIIGDLVWTRDRGLGDEGDRNRRAESD